MNSTNKILKIGTRGSKLALRQAAEVQQQLAVLGYNSEIVAIKTTGDKILNKTLYDIGGKALFLKEIEEALINKDIDLAVHSMKDVPAHLPDALHIVAVLAREDPHDVLISKHATIAELPENAVIGTSSVRRIVQLQAVHKFVRIENIRGNIDSRLNRYLNGEFDAILLAKAGLNRLGIIHDDFHSIATDIMVPAVGQGIVAIELRKDDTELLAICQQFNHLPTWYELQAERGFLETLQGDCRTPMGALATTNGTMLNVKFFLASNDGSNIQKTSATCKVGDGYQLGVQVANKFTEKIRSQHGYRNDI